MDGQPIRELGNLKPPVILEDIKKVEDLMIKVYTTCR